MKIDKDITKANLLNDLAKSSRTNVQKEASSAKQGTDLSDKVELSGKNRDITSLIAKVNASPSVRQDKVDSIREAIQNGTYKAGSEEVAKAILKNSLLNEML